jgi:tetratricopeptide (TPR) repeat protein
MRAGCVLAALLAAGCLGPGGVTRVADGEVQRGREIHAEAYASYLRAATFEATGDRKQALDELERALDADPGSPEILTRFAELTCGASPRLPPVSAAVPADAAERALLHFSRALEAEPRYAPAWLGRAVCLESRGQRREALAMATRAAALDPLRPESTRVMVRLLRAVGRREEAARWLSAYRVLVPAPLDPEPPTGDSGVGSERAHASRSLERAFSDRDLAAARAAALELGMSRSALALLAATAAPELAIEQALSILAADPTDSDALIAALTAADRVGDSAHFEQALHSFAGEPLPASPRAKELFAEVLARHAGSAGLDAWLGRP